MRVTPATAGPAATMAWLSWMEMYANASVSLEHQDWPVHRDVKWRVSRVSVAIQNSFTTAVSSILVKV